MSNCQVFANARQMNDSPEQNDCFKAQVLPETEMLPFAIWCNCFSAHDALQIAASHE